MLNRQARQFGESLVERHVLAPDVLEDAMDESARMNLPLPTILLQRGLVGPKDLAAALCVALGMDVRRLRRDRRPAQRRRTPSPRRSPASSPPSASRSSGDSIVVAFADPADHAALGEVSDRGARGDRPQRHRPPAPSARSSSPRSKRAYGPTDADDRAAPRRSRASTPSCTACSSGSRRSTPRTSTSPPASRRSSASSVTCTG